MKVSWRLPVPPLLVISDRRQACQPLEAVARAAFAGGCRWFSLREKDLPPEERLRLLARLVAIDSVKVLPTARALNEFGG